jgi:hypothetical protein
LALFFLTSLVFRRSLILAGRLNTSSTTAAELAGDALPSPSQRAANRESRSLPARDATAKTSEFGTSPFSYAWIGVMAQLNEALPAQTFGRHTG